MRLWKVLFSVLITLNIFTFCTPPPDLIKEETIGDLHFKGKYTKEDTEYFVNFFKEMQEAVNSKDAEKAFSFYSKDFMSDSGVKLDELKKNTVLIYKVYDNVKYTMLNINLHIRDKEAVSTDDYAYSAMPIAKGYKPLDYKGKERIYWEKENNEWKIVNWVYE